MDKTAIFGGTFNPFHNGHLEIVKTLLSLEDISRVIVIPTAVPPHKESPLLASGEHRLAMCRLALEGEDRVEVSDIEISRGGRSYTYDTIMQLKEMLNTDISITCGADMINTLSSWYRYGDLIREAVIIAFRRAGVDNTRFDEAVRGIIADGGTVRIIEKDITDISSSAVRDEGKTDVPQAVLNYIKENGLYGG